MFKIMDVHVFKLVFFVLTWNHVRLQNCQVEDIPVQTNFDFNKLMGKWYVISWFADDVTDNSPGLTDYIQNIAQTGDNDATIYAQGRSSSNPDECEPTISFLNTPDSSAKLLWTSHNVTSPFWILDTDYTGYTFVYGCYNISNDGTCSGARAWVWSRTKSLPQNLLDRTQTFYQNICIEEAAFETISFNRDCPLKPMWPIIGMQDCDVSQFPVQEDFDVDKYMGTWYEASWLAPSSVPASEYFQDFQHRYVRLENGHIYAYTYGRLPVEREECLYSTIDLVNTSTPAKFYYVGRNNGVVFPYWVLRTDYTQYAVVYGCYNVSSDGSCYQARSWVWSRTPTLPDQLRHEANSLLQNICVNPTIFVSTEQKNECPLRPAWPDNRMRNCNVSQLPVEADFEIDKFARMWYETHRLPVGISANLTNRQIEVFSTREGLMTIFSRHRNANGCVYTEAEYAQTEDPAKFVRGSTPLWIADTDYENYAVVYSCWRVGSSGGCSSPRGEVWSRTPTLAPHHRYTANSVLQNLCLNPAVLVPTEQNNACMPQRQESCPPSSKGSSISTSSIIVFLLMISYSL